MEGVKEYKTQLVKQVKINAPSGQCAVCRYDVIKGILMFQNRSKDISMCLDDFLDRMNTTVKQSKERGFTVSITDVPIGSKWPQI